MLSGPSSKERETQAFLRLPRQITGKKKPTLVAKGATRQSPINPARGKIPHTGPQETNNKPARINAAMPVISAVVNIFFAGIFKETASGYAFQQ
jgi:3-deoxy-D-arabino-heptulosonate 7-phosphate (DAHP) synthase